MRVLENWERAYIQRAGGDKIPAVVGTCEGRIVVITHFAAVEGGVQDTLTGAAYTLGKMHRAYVKALRAQSLIS